MSGRVGTDGDPGYVYVIEDQGRLKIGKTKDAITRMRAASTWLPDMKLLACKPFWHVSEVEHYIHAGFSAFWYSGEWFVPDDDARECLLFFFSYLSDTDHSENTRDFARWCNSDGLSESIMEHGRQGVSLRKFLKDTSFSKKETK